MTLNEYQKRAMSTKMPSSNNYTYMAEGLAAEVGEFLGKVAKAVRKDKVEIMENQLRMKSGGCDVAEYMDFREELAYEIGDVLWFIAGVADQLGFSLDDIAAMNEAKLASRARRNVIDGEGDHR